MGTTTLLHEKKRQECIQNNGLSTGVGISIMLAIGLGIILTFVLIVMKNIYLSDDISIYCENQHIAGPLISNVSLSSYQRTHLTSLTSTYQVILRQSLPNRINVPLMHIKQEQNGINKGSFKIVRYLSFDYSSEYTSPVITMGVAVTAMILLLERNIRLRLLRK